MGMFGLGRVATTRAAEVLTPGRKARISSPWAPAMSASVLAADWLGVTDTFPTTREQAMKVPAVASARDILCTSLAAGVLHAYRGPDPVTDPTWMYRTDSDVAPYTRMLWTVDDLFFSGYSLWEVDRGTTGVIGDAVRVPVERWDWDDDMRVQIDEQPVQAADVVLFTWINEGLLVTGNSVIRAALDLQAEVARRVRVPQAHTIIKSVDQSAELEDDEITTLLEEFVAARRSPNGAVSYMPFGVDVDRGGEAPVSLYENGRNSAVLDIARLTGVPASMLDASAVSASLTYETRAGQRSILNDRLRQRAQTIEARLSMDDVLPRGQRTVLDLSHLQTDETGLPATTED